MYCRWCYSTLVNCPGGGIGRHAGLRSQCLGVTVRVRSGAPLSTNIIKKFQKGKYSYY